MIRAAYTGLILVMAFGNMGMESEAIALEEDAAEKVMRVQRVLDETRPPHFMPQLNPAKPTRCPRENVDRERLRHSYAYQADGGEWIHQCHYGVRS